MRRAVTLNAGENNLTSAVIDTFSGFAYFGTSTTPGMVIKVKHLLEVQEVTDVEAEALKSENQKAAAGAGSSKGA